MNDLVKVTPGHTKRTAFVYIRQSSPAQVQEELNSVRQSEQQRRSLAKQYQSCIADLELKEEITDEPRFLELRQWAESEQAEQSKIIMAAANEEAVAEQEFAKLRKQHEGLEDQLRSLRERPDLIPERERKMRLFIANGAGVEVQELPFAGELMDVKPSSLRSSTIKIPGINRFKKRYQVSTGGHIQRSLDTRCFLCPFSYEPLVLPVRDE